MTLTTRLTIFFLTGLALTLLAFSLAVFFLVREGLYGETDARLTATLDTLTAAAEIDRDSVEWEPGERQLSIGRGPGGGAVWWTVAAPDERRIDAAKSTDESPPFDPAHRGRVRPFTQSDDRRGAWRMLRKRIDPDKSRPIKTDGAPSELEAAKRHDHLELTAALPLAPIHAALARLVVVLAGVSLTIWLVALGGSRWVCRRALRPVTDMASRASAMTVADLGERLPVPTTRDELATLGTSFNGLLDRVEDAYERQRRFTGDASHQLRTPLAALLGQVEVSLRHPRSAEEYRETLEKVHGRGEHLRLIVESLLFLTRADAEAQPAALEAVDLADWLRGHLASWSNHPRAADLRMAATGGPYFVKIHPTLFGQLLDNVLDNAVKHSPAGSPVDVAIQTNETSVVLAIADRGPGIAAADLPLIFEPFFRSADVRRAGLAGVGLGLAIARRIAAAHGSTITVDSEPPHGCRFEVRLPRDRSERIPEA